MDMQPREFRWLERRLSILKHWVEIAAFKMPRFRTIIDTAVEQRALQG
jgi:hypothetical protein